MKLGIEMDKTTCMNCGEPAMSSIGTLPLCPRCQSLKSSPRGVQFQSNQEDAEKQSPAQR